MSGIKYTINGETVNEKYLLGIKSFKNFAEGDNPYNLIWLDFIPISKINDGEYSLFLTDSEEIKDFANTLRKQSELLNLKVLRNPEVYVFKNHYQFSFFKEITNIEIINIGEL